MVHATSKKTLTPSVPTTLVSSDGRAIADANNSGFNVKWDSAVRVFVNNVYTQISSHDGNSGVGVENNGLNMTSRGYSLLDSTNDLTRLWCPDNNSYLTLNNTEIEAYGPTSVQPASTSEYFTLKAVSGQTHAGGTMKWKSGSAYSHDWILDNFWGNMRLFANDSSTRSFVVENAGTGKATIAVNANGTAFLDVGGDGAGTNNSVLCQLRQGNSSNYNVDNNNQIIFTYAGNQWNVNGYAHTISTRHNSGAETGNAIDFHVWQQGTDNANAIGTGHRLSITQNGIGICKTDPGRELDVNGSFECNGDVWLTGLKDTDPHIAGKLWNDNGTPKISSG